MHGGEQEWRMWRLEQGWQLLRMFELSTTQRSTCTHERREVFTKHQEQWVQCDILDLWRWVDGSLDPWFQDLGSILMHVIAAGCNGWVRGHFLRWCSLGFRTLAAANYRNPEWQSDRGFPSPEPQQTDDNPFFGPLAANLALANVRPVSGPADCLSLRVSSNIAPRQINTHAGRKASEPGQI